MNLSVVVPCYNEEETLPELVRRLDAACRTTAVDYELVVVNDGSTDATWPTLLLLQEQYPALVLVDLARNHGHQLALTAGLQVCRGERILTIDADLQDPPELLPDMMARMDQGADVVYGQRRVRSGETWFKKQSAAWFYRLLNALSDVRLPEDAGDFRLMSRRVLDVFLRMPEQNRYIRGMIGWIGFRQEPIAYDRDARFAGETKYPLRKMLRLSLDAITSFSTKPLKMTAYLAFAFSLLGIGLLLYSIVSWLFFDTIRGWTSLLAVISIISSLQFLILAIIGAYLGRVYQQSQQRPLTIVREVVRPGKGTA
jgi:glycosyltransferase involved in cell wall biosynthesis